MEDYTVMVPVFEEVEALKFSSDFLRSCGVRPVYVLDSKRAARRAEVEAVVQEDVAIFENPGNFIEAGYESMASQSPTDWIFRIDCDEVPNLAALRHCDAFVRNPSDIYCGFDRDDLVWRGEHFERLKYSLFFFDSQYRLFDRRKVKFISRIHTPGFAFPRWKLPMWPQWHAPRAARIYHLSKVFRSFPERIQKQSVYNREGQEAQFDAWSRRSDESFSWSPMKDEKLTTFFRDWVSGSASSG